MENEHIIRRQPLMIHFLNNFVYYPDRSVLHKPLDSV